MATSVGVPHTAPVGCSAATSDSTEWSLACPARASLPLMAVARCCTLASRMREGRPSTLSSSHSGASVSRTPATAYSCSSVSLAEESRLAPSALSSSASRPRGMVPASTSELMSSSCRLIRSSGVAPTSPAQANV
jgi:hypothetical protein